MSSFKLVVFYKSQTQVTEVRINECVVYLILLAPSPFVLTVTWASFFMKLPNRSVLNKDMAQNRSWWPIFVKPDFCFLYLIEHMYKNILILRARTYSRICLQNKKTILYRLLYVRAQYMYLMSISIMWEVFHVAFLTSSMIQSMNI